MTSLEVAGVLAFAGAALCVYVAMARPSISGQMLWFLLAAALIWGYAVLAFWMSART